MNPEEVKKEYFKTLKYMSESDTPQDRRTALAEWGKVYRQDQLDQVDLIEKLSSMLETYMKLVTDDTRAEIIKSLDKNTSIPFTVELLTDLDFLQKTYETVENGKTKPEIKGTPLKENKFYRAVVSEGIWPKSLLFDINGGRQELQRMGAFDMEPILVFNDDQMKLLDLKISDEETYREFLENNHLISAVVNLKSEKTDRAFMIAFNYSLINNAYLKPEVYMVIIKKIKIFPS